MTQAIMTVSNLIQDAIAGLMDLVREINQKRKDKAMARITFKSLQQLSDHELKDLGIGRSDITSISLGTFNDRRMNVVTNKNLKGWV
jgi:uncharacterized protein YjiS (DUF1127 family)|tara:strand:- start:1219 stop:1479 length:261 start_codon:yes stop_codon:yes gene_type:complete